MTHITDRLNAALADRYRIERELGAGGMATVYLAHDIKHDRDVAIKVLHPDLGAALGGERFLSEIKTTAKLQHPHILPLLDSGDANGVLYYVMPFVAGESLKARLEREAQLPIADSVRIALEIADAIGYAHSVGIVHRDIKPENILLQNGHALVADFGIAVAMQQAGGLRLTQSGMSIGTPQYMSPEQSMGQRSLDARSDIYSLGAVLYEMLVGEPPFTGPNAQAIVSRRMSELPRSVATERPSVPMSIDAVVARALQRTPADRFGTASDFANALSAWRNDATPSQFARPLQKRQSRLIVALVGALVATTAIAAWSARRKPISLQAASTARFALPADRDHRHFLGGIRDAQWGYPGSTAFALSPDGTQLVYVAWEADSGGRTSSRLYIRALADERVTPISGTDSAFAPFFSPDGKWVGFFAGGMIRRAPVSGGPVETVLARSAENWKSASWGDDGAIITASRNGLFRVPANGGEPTLIVPIDSVGRSFTRYDQPHVLPGSKVVLFHRQRASDVSAAEILALDIASKRVTSVVAHAMNPLFAPNGYLLFAREGKLFAVSFDAGKAKVTGQAVSVIDDVMQAVGMPNVDWNSGAAQVAISRAGHLVYASGGVYPQRMRQIVRVSRDGSARPILSEPREYVNVRVSHDGERLLLQARSEAKSGLRSSLFIHDLARNVTSPVNTGGFNATRPIWSGNGRAIAYSSDRDSSVANVYVVPTEGSSVPKPVAPGINAQIAAAWSSQGVLAYLERGRIWTLSPGGAAKLISSQTAKGAFEQFPAFSPDGKWLAYTTSETGRSELFVREFPGPGAATKIGDGDGAVWAPSGKQIYFLGGPIGQRVSLMVADITLGTPLRVAKPNRLFEWTNLTSTPVASHDAFPDGSFAVVVDSGSVVNGRMTPGPSERIRFRVSEMHVVLNYLDELRARMSR